MGSSRGYIAPKSTPDDVKEKLLKSFEQMTKDPDFIKGIKDLGLTLDLKLGDDYKKYLKDQEKPLTDIWNSVKDQYLEVKKNS